MDKTVKFNKDEEFYISIKYQLYWLILIINLILIILLHTSLYENVNIRYFIIIIVEKHRIKVIFLERKLN